jgi:hyperosmotically inducible protein
MKSFSNKTRWLAILPMLLALTVVATGCATNRSATAQMDDAGITAAVKSRLAADPDVAALNIDVDTMNGVVTLSGMVNSAAERTEAVQIAAGTDDVVRVVNNLQIKS